MKKFNYPSSNYVVVESILLAEALEVITLNQRGAVVVVNDKGILLGILSDGDVRRALLRGATLATPVSKLINLNVISLSNKESLKDRSKEIFETKTVVNIIPVVDSRNKVVDIIVRNPGVRKES
ncbi:MAG: hypothetical protein A2665_01100 [Candidatus Zambryskibacteria bacterium RIFCSPHIGHO2_01_FULL_46_30]|uniref:CBS domain-containing protein n=1 Tax=Candidatus Zambryskibacteria bacterium RIFCSPHIGHO2_01_FULL_46_30 TaxID=1802739 RepID=A0A1G2T1D7_9BACT|nr:MAG: hypothetical protein A2665_01100 [Candidatus Zambryskibacteria bacterium RIFCSPHIGHO2_01_FULL_46_30]OHB06087.1 MAG: hypothetical protein A3B22_02210 [Candidatus Zambryskibacteria bacterium RIFCSPLOWO2_01_FULL_47_33]